MGLILIFIVALLAAGVVFLIGIAAVVLAPVLGMIARGFQK